MTRISQTPSYVLFACFAWLSVLGCARNHGSDLNAVAVGSSNTILINSLKSDASDSKLFWLYTRNVDKQPLRSASFCVGAFADCKAGSPNLIAGEANNAGEIKGDVYFSSPKALDFSGAVDKQIPFVVTTVTKQTNMIVSEYFMVKIDGNDLVFTANGASAPIKQDNLSPAQTAVVKGDVNDLNPAEVRVMELMNQYRVSRGLAVCTITKRLSFFAYTNAVLQLFKRASFHWASTKEFQYANANSASFNGAAEITYYGITTAEAAMEGWLKSPPHKAQIDINYQTCGVSAIWDKQLNAYLSWTVTFQ